MTWCRLEDYALTGWAGFLIGLVIGVWAVGWRNRRERLALKLLAFIERTEENGVDIRCGTAPGREPYWEISDHWNQETISEGKGLLNVIEELPD